MKVATLLVFALGAAALASDGGKAPLGEVAEHAVLQSKLTLPGSKPFHLKAEIVETTNPDSEYQAKIEEHWVAPGKWRRTIEAPGFSQTLIVNGDQVSEKDEGDYFPWWLNDLVTAMTDPLPMLEQLNQIPAQISRPQGPENSTTCSYVPTKIDRWVFCFEGSHGLLTSVFVRGYDAEFKDYRGFAGKRVPRLILIGPEPGTTIQARITELTELQKIDDALFTISQVTAPERQIKSIRVDEDKVRELALGSTEIAWPAVGGGPMTGRCAVYISADRSGHIREVWPHGCDNPGLEDPLRELVSKWQLRPAVHNGAAVQIEALVTFTFNTKLVSASSPQGASDVEAPGTGMATPVTQSKEPSVVPPRIITMVKPDCSLGHDCNGIHGDVDVVVDVLADGRVGDVTVRSGDPQLFEAAKEAAKKCRFEPGTFLGKPTKMTTDLKYQF